jgi:acetate---CoA ligase (ADP-forming)
LQTAAPQSTFAARRSGIEATCGYAVKIKRLEEGVTTNTTIDMAMHGEVFPDVSGLLEPNSIAVIGASDRPGNLGGVAVQFLRKFGYPGAIWPVNPKQQTVAGLPCFPRPQDLPRPADLAILAIAASAIPAMIRECAAAGIYHGVAWAGGFAEVGGDGVELQRTLVAACQETGFKLCGPNCIGLINNSMPMTATFASSLVDADRLLSGNISMVSQSGGITTITQALAQQAGFGFRYVISSGNEAVLSVADFIHALVLDPQTKVIAAYVEGIRDGGKFLAALEEARVAHKPVVILKGGATAASAQAAAAHTGALAGEDRVWDAIFREKAVMRVHSQEELLDVIMFLSGIDMSRLPKGNGVMAMTFGGGPGVLAADDCVRNGLASPRLNAATVERLKTLLPPIASLANPCDLTPDTYNQPKWFELFPKALDVIAADSNVDTLVFQCGAMAHKAQEVVGVISALRDRTDKPICVTWPLASKLVMEQLPAAGIYPFSDHSRGIRAIGHLVRYQEALAQPPRPRQDNESVFEWSAFVPDPSTGLVISEHDCHRILAAAGLPVAAGRLSTSVEDATGAASDVGYPVAMKGISSAVTHRAAAGLLELNLRSEQEVRDGYLHLVEQAGQLGVNLDGVYVQHMVRGGLEFLVSAFRDQQFGVVVSCGAGGNQTELIDDITLERAPLDVPSALSMLNRLRIVRRALRREPGTDLTSVAEFVARFSRLALSAPWKRFVLEVNPIKWSRDGVAAVDGLLIIEEP